MNIPAPLPTEQRVPRPLQGKKKKAAEAKLAEKLDGLAATFGPKHPPKVRQEKVEKPAFDPFAPRDRSGQSVDWEAQRKAQDQQRTEGKRKNQSGKKS